MGDVESEAQAVAIRLRRLAVPIAQDDLPGFDELGLTLLVDEATTWQQLRAGGWFWGLTSIVAPGSPDRWTEISNLFGSTAESVLLAAAAEVEVAALRKTILDGRVHRYYGISQRFFAEAQGSVLVGACHRLANILARALMMDDGYPWGAAVPKGLRKRFPANTNDREHWVPMEWSPHLQVLAEASQHQGLKRGWVTP